MHTNYYKIVKLLKKLIIILVAPTCFGLHKPSSGSSVPDDGLCKPKHVGATNIILSYFNSLTTL